MERASNYLDGARIWGGLGIGLLLARQACGIFIASVLCFVGQLAALPAEFAGVEKQACTLLCRGPGSWITPGCLTHLKGLYFLTEMVDLQSRCLAARARVFRQQRSACD